MLSSRELRNELKISGIRTKPSTILHEACSIHTIPFDLIQSIVHLIPSACRERDEDGNLPLHLLYIESVTGVEYGHTECNPSSIRNDLLHLLLRTYPESSLQPLEGGGTIPFYALVRASTKVEGATKCSSKTLELLSSMPCEAFFNDQISVLHQVSDHLLPDPVVSYIIERFPQICQLQTFGNTLLHILCSHHCSNHDIIQKVIKIYPHACSIQDEQGNLPLHLVASSHHSKKVMEALIYHNPQALVTRNREGRIPLRSKIISCSSKSIRELLQCSIGVFDIQSFLKHSKNINNMTVLHELYYDLQQNVSNSIIQNTSLIQSLSTCPSSLRNQLHSSHVEEIKSLYHTMCVAIYNKVDYPQDCPHDPSFWLAFPLFTKLMLSLYPSLAFQKDCHGDFPLNIVARNISVNMTRSRCHRCEHMVKGPLMSFSNRTTYCTKCIKHSSSWILSHGLVDYQQYSLVTDLLVLNPSAASNRDLFGNYPLHDCLKNGMTQLMGIGEVFEAAPSVAMYPESKDCLFVFSLASIARNSDEFIDKGEKLTTIYELIRQNPSLIN